MKLWKLLVPLLVPLVACSYSPSSPSPESPPTTLTFSERLKSLDQSTVGPDFLGINNPNVDCDAFLRSENTRPGKHPCGSFVDKTFSGNDTCLKRWLSSGKCSVFRGHLAWNKHQPTPMWKLQQSAIYFNKLAGAYPEIDFYPSRECEHHDNSSVSAQKNAQLRGYFTASNIKNWVDSGMYGQDPGAARECHGVGTFMCHVASLDGHSAVDVDVEFFKKRGEYFSWLWSREYNCRLEHESGTNPATRVNCPTQDQFNLLTRLSYQQQPPPTGRPPQCRTVVFPNSEHCWKTSAENYGKIGNKPSCSGRDCDPVWITKFNGKEVPILAIDGVQLGVMRGKSSYAGGRSRYYLGGAGSGQSAFQLGQKAEIQSGLEWVFLNENGKCTLVNSYRRSGFFRP